MPDPGAPFPGCDRGATPLLLAPMAGYTRAPMRRLCRQQGAAMSFTEMVSSDGLANHSDKTWDLLETFEDEGPVGAHLYGSDPGALAEAAARAAATGRFAVVDLNAGCPAPKITASGAGAALLDDPARLHAILSAMRQATSLPLTLKTRLGPRPDRVAIFEILDAAQRAGADALTLHGRFASQGHGGHASLDLMAEVKRRASIPIAGNGGARDARAAWRMLRETGVDAIMIARGAIGDPWIFHDLRAALDAKIEPPPRPATSGRPQRDLETVRAALEAHLAGEAELEARVSRRHEATRDAPRSIEARLAVTFRCHLFRYLHGFKGSSYLRSRLHALQTLADIRAAVDACLAREAAFRAAAPKPASAPSDP